MLPVKHRYCGTKGSLCLVSVCPYISAFVWYSHAFLVVTNSYASHVTHTFLGMLPFWFIILMAKEFFIIEQNYVKNDRLTKIQLCECTHVTGCKIFVASAKQSAHRQASLCPSSVRLSGFAFACTTCIFGEHWF